MKYACLGFLAFVLLQLAGINKAFSHNQLSTIHIPKKVKNTIKQRVDFGLLKGISIAVSDSSGVSFYSEGLTSEKNGNQVDENTQFEIGSISKTFTASLFVDAVIRGEVGLNDSINQYLFPVLENRNLDGITLTALANHHSGLDRMPNNFSPTDPLNPYADYTIENLYTYLKGLDKSELSTGHYQYSNTGAGLLAHTLELATATDFTTLLKSRITDKLEMRNTTTSLSNNQEQLAKGHNGGVASNWTFDSLIGAGGILSSAKDMMIYLQSQFNTSDLQLKSAFSKTRTISKTKIFGKTSIGLGWFIEQQPAELAIVYHDGNTNGYWSFAGFLADGSKAVVVLSNSGNENINDIGLHLLNSSYQLATAPSHQEVRVKVNQLKSYVGTYSNIDGLQFEVSLDGENLKVALNSQKAFPIYASAENKFFYRDLRAEISFDTYKDKPTLTLYQDGEKYMAQKHNG